MAKVDGDAVTVTEVQRTAQNMAQQQRYPAQFVPFLMPQAAEMLIKQKAVLVEARRMGLTVSDEELRGILHKGQFGEMLFPKGQYVGDEQYANMVQQNFSMTVPQFEEELKKSIEIQKLRNVVEASATVSDSEVENLVRQQQTKAKFEYVAISMQDISKNDQSERSRTARLVRSAQGPVQGFDPRKAQGALCRRSTAASFPACSPPTRTSRRYYNQHKTEYQVPETSRSATSS